MGVCWRGAVAIFVLLTTSLVVTLSNTAAPGVVVETVGRRKIQHLASNVDNPGKKELNQRPRRPSRPKDVCAVMHINDLFRRKDLVDQQLRSQSEKVQSDSKLTKQDKVHRMKIINIIQREMNESVSSINNSLAILKSLLQGDHNSVIQLKETSKKRLSQLQASMLIAEDVYNIIAAAEKEEHHSAEEKDKKHNGGRSKNILKKFMSELLSDISVAADKLESRLDDDAFKNEMHSKNRYSVETVIKVGGDQSKGRLP